MLKKTLGFIKKTEQQSKKQKEEFEKMAKSNQMTKNKVKERINTKSKEFEKKQINKKKHFDIIHNK
ncbi:hypothetical protein I6G82_02410 [Lysinibacillus macroides]|uniref:Uncharacterized protein n=1 Tax=Lysinibacillus macroides TaxID=33935 RepID=A0A0M9DIV6_9BACI|nr:hypothetical protein [Lysinibacillus macroides]KOY81326.1 hypothetical protein ADM90_19555 [Lysinibacillus macroides]QPR68506.1 hypothetical protein I6G82_02410 [Lysinibacillus macroides]